MFPFLSVMPRSQSMQQRNNLLSPQAAEMVRNSQISSRPVASTLADYVYAYGGRPILRSGDARVIGGPFHLQVSVLDNAAVNQDLRGGNVWDKRTQRLYSNASTPLKAVLHLEGISLYMNDGNFGAESAALKAQLDNEAYITIGRAGNTQDLPLRTRVWEAATHFQFAQAAAAAETRVAWGRRPDSVYLLEKPLRVDLEVDTFSFRVDNPINWVSAAQAGYIILQGVLAPKDLLGAGGVSDVSCSAAAYAEDVGGAPTAVGPVEFLGYSALLRGLTGSTRYTG